MSSTTSFNFILALSLALFFVTKAVDVHNETGLPSQLEPEMNDMSISGSEHVASEFRSIDEYLNEPCSLEGLMFFKEVNENYELYPELDDNMLDKCRRYKSKCLFTFIVNIYPFWSDQESRDSFSDWTEIAATQLRKFQIKDTIRMPVDITFVYRFQTFLDPEKDLEFSERLLFSRYEGSSSSQESKKILDAKAAFASGKDGYCWPMKSETFVTINQMMEIFLTVFYQVSLQAQNKLFSNKFLVKSFNLYSICKNIQRNTPNKLSSVNLSGSFKYIAELPIVDVSLEDTDFSFGYLESLHISTDECTPRKLISFTATEETLECCDNKKLKNYLQYETNIAKNVIIETCREGSRPRYRYSLWLMKIDCGVSVLLESVYRVAVGMNVIEMLKNGNVGQVSNLMSDKETHLLIVKQIGAERNPRILTGISRSYITSNDNLSKLCKDFKITHRNNNQCADSLSYLFHHYSHHAMIVSILDEANSEVLRYFLTSLVCQSLSQSSTSSE